MKLRTSQGERWVEGAVFEHTTPRLVLVDGVAIEAPLEGTMIVICNTDQPGVIGDVGTILGAHGSTSRTSRWGATATGRWAS